MAQESAFSKTIHEDSHHTVEIDELDPSASPDSLKSAAASFLAARLELASIEAKEAAGFAASKAVHGAILGISAFFTWALALAGLTGVLAPMATRWLSGKTDWLPGWAAVLFAFAILHGIAVIICVVLLKKKPSSPLFELTRQEIKNDKQWLAKNK